MGVWVRLLSVTLVGEDHHAARPIHNRMPVMSSNDDALRWRNVVGEIAHALSLLKPYPPDDIEGYDASLLVNNPRHDSPECMRPIGG